MLSRRVGVQSIEAVEDAVQSALMTGLETWAKMEVPANPTAWLFLVAQNNLMSGFRQRAGQLRILERHAEDPLFVPEETDSEYFLAGK